MPNESIQFLVPSLFLAGMFLVLQKDGLLRLSGIWLIVRGINSGISHYFFLGITAILVIAFMRYIDLIGEYIGGAILFTMLAVLLLGAARYWKRQQIKEARS